MLTVRLQVNGYGCGTDAVANIWWVQLHLWGLRQVLAVTWDGVDIEPVAVAEDLKARRPVHQQQRDDAVVAVRAAPQKALRIIARRCLQVMFVFA